MAESKINLYYIAFNIKEWNALFYFIYLADICWTLTVWHTLPGTRDAEEIKKKKNTINDNQS